MIATVAMLLTAFVAVPTSPAQAEHDDTRLFDLFDGDAPADDWQNTYLLSLLSHYAYEGNLPGSGAFRPRYIAAFEQLGLSRFIELDESFIVGPVVVDTQGMIVETEDAMIVVIRGTEGGLDIATDGLIVPNPVDQTHSGFRSASLAVFEDVRDIARATDKPVWFTGHSLGGAVTQDLAYQLRDDPQVEIGGVVTFGQPQTYALGLAQGIYRTHPLANDTELWLNDNDPVPHAIGSLSLLYTLSRVGAENHIRVSGGQCFRADGYVPGDAALIFDDHDTKRYATRILNLMPAAERQEFAQFTNRPGGGIKNPPPPSKPVVDCDDLPDFPGTITAHIEGELSSNGAWYRSDVEVSWHIRGLGKILIREGCGTTTITADTNGQTLTCTVTNQEGRQFSESILIRRDTTPPDVELAFSRLPNENGWFNAPVTYFVDSSSDSGSGVIFCSKSGFYSGPDRAQGLLVSLGCTDSAGNRGVDRGVIRYDATPPTISIKTPADGATYLLGQDVRANFGCDDQTSGMASCVGSTTNGKSLDTSTFGKGIFSVTATDQASNTATRSVSYQVAYSLEGGSLSDLLESPDKNSIVAGDKFTATWQLRDDGGKKILGSDELFSAGWSAPVSCTNPGSSSAATVDMDFAVTSSLKSGTYKAKTTTSKDWNDSCRFFVVEVAGGGQQAYLFNFR